MFTIPDKLSALAFGNRREVYNLLFRLAWRSLREVIEEEQWFEPTAAMVLHTWISSAGSGSIATKSFRCVRSNGSRRASSYSVRLVLNPCHP